MSGVGREPEFLESFADAEQVWGFLPKHPKRYISGLEFAILVGQVSFKARTYSDSGCIGLEEVGVEGVESAEPVPPQVHAADVDSEENQDEGQAPQEVNGPTILLLRHDGLAELIEFGMWRKS